MTRLINPVPQLLDDAGDPLVSGKLHFYESNTDTLKDTFADVSETIKNTNPVILSGSGRAPNAFYSGSAKVILTDAKNNQIWVRDPVGGTNGAAALSDWSALIFYGENDVVTGSDGHYYASLVNGNQGNSPIISPESWTQVRFIRIWNNNETYEALRIVQGSDGNLYRSIDDLNAGNNPVGDGGVNWTQLTGASTGLDAQAITSSADVSIGTAASPTVVGNSVSLDIPAKGRIIWSPDQFQVDAVGAASSISPIFAIKISGTVYTVDQDVNGTVTAVGQYQATSAGQYRVFGTGAALSTFSSGMTLCSEISFNIESLGVPTGTQTVELVVYEQQDDANGLIKGTTTTTRSYMYTEDYT